MDPILPKAVATAFCVLLVGLVLRRFHQPHVIAYLLAGVLIGPHGLSFLNDPEAAARLGDAGVVLLLFFVGMEVSLKRLAENWRLALIGTSLQVLVTVGLLLLLGVWLGWPTGRSVLLAFVVSLSSTAVVVSILREWGEVNSDLGNDALGVLIVQDLAIVPMLLIIGLMGEQSSHASDVVLQVVGGAAVVALIGVIMRRGSIKLPFAARLRSDHELQVFSAFVLCFGFATLTALLHLSTALGAFVAGIVVASAKETEWVHESLDALRVLLVALFFVSVGMLLDVVFLLEHWLLVAGLVVAVMLLNTAVNAGIFRALGRDWRTSLFMGSILAQVGEFSFVLAAVGLQNRLISSFGYQISVGLIALTLLLSPGWISIFRRIAGFRRSASADPSMGSNQRSA
ncbi:MAG: cation:proton antiporter [Myxococcales bacterium]|nr:cation:proton antiporter [Myxococcales bacterium]